MWWPRRGDSAGDGDTEQDSGRWAMADVAVAGREPPVEASVVPRQIGPHSAITPEQLGAALHDLDITYVRDADGGFVAMWERHAVLFALEGPADDILVIRARPLGTVPIDWAHRAYEVVNEWNHARRYVKAYVADANGLDQLPIYAEMQVPFGAGVQCGVLADLLSLAVTELGCFVDWLHDGGALL